MKVIMIAPEPFFEPRGTPISVFQRLMALSALGYSVDLVTYHVGKDVEIPNVKIHRVKNLKTIQSIRVGPSRVKLVLDILVFLKAFRLLLRNRYDVIHSHEEAAFFSMLLGWMFRTRHLYDMHSVLSRQLKNFEFGNAPLFIKIFEVLERRVLKTCQAVIVVGKDLEDYVKSVDPQIKVDLVENIALHSKEEPITEEALKHLRCQYKLDGKRTVVYTGTFERYQGLDMMLDCAKIVKRHVPDAQFIFVGAKNTQRNDWTAKAMAAGLGGHTLFLDVVSPEDSLAFLSCAEVLISPRLEGLSIPLKIYSYLYSGRPIVATNISAHTQVLNSEIALLVEPTAEDFARGIIQILQEPATAERLGENAFQYAEKHFNFENYLMKIRKVYQSV